MAAIMNTTQGEISLIGPSSSNASGDGAAVDTDALVWKGEVSHWVKDKITQSKGRAY
jgi:hypothetical protein